MDQKNKEITEITPEAMEQVSGGLSPVIIDGRDGQEINKNTVYTDQN